jgi:hypothetical protein
LENLVKFSLIRKKIGALSHKQKTHKLSVAPNKTHKLSAVPNKCRVTFTKVEVLIYAKFL